MIESRRSRTGCLTCRQRKLKCDEAKPECAQCRRASRRCQPSDGLVFRHQQNASMNGNSAEEGRTAGSKRFYNYRNTFEEDQIWLDIPGKITFFDVLDPYASEEIQNAGPSIDQTHVTNYSVSTVKDLGVLSDEHLVTGLEVLSAAASGGRLSSGRHRKISNIEYIQHEETLDFQVEADYSPPSIIDVIPSSPNVLLSVTQIRAAYNGVLHTLSPETEHESLNSIGHEIVDERQILFLMRTFSEITGRWMDHFDSGCYFSHFVPVKARSEPLLWHAACACAAKQLSKMKNPSSTPQQVGLPVCQDPFGHDWARHGMKHYAKATKLLADEISVLRVSKCSDGEQPNFIHKSQPSSSSEMPASWTLVSPISSRKGDGGDTISDVLTAAAILGAYELLDNNTVAWTEHLSGAKNLFGFLCQRDAARVDEKTLPKYSRAARTAFWNFARQDFLTSFTSGTHTHIEGKDLSHWLAAGLVLDEEGLIGLGNNTGQHDCQPDDMVHNALIWILMKITNFLAMGDSIDNVFPQDPSSPTSLLGINQLTLLEYWLQLERELDKWAQDLPETFTPYTLTEASKSPDSVFPEIWFSSPACASTMQYYHMARITLLVNKPQESTAKRSTIGSRLQSYRHIDEEVCHHSRKICGIALGRAEASGRIHMIQPLFVAGQCLMDSSERQKILNILREIESDVGWATEYYIKDLLAQWDT